MSKKNIKLGIILGVLVFSAYIYSGPLKDWRQNNEVPANFFSSLDTQKIELIKIKKFNEMVELEKSDKGWKVLGTKDFYAPNYLIENIFETIKEAGDKNFSLVSDQADRKIDFGTDESGLKISLDSAEENFVSFVLGQMTPDYVSVYVSKDDMDETYSVKAPLFSVFNQSEWRDMVVFKSNPENVNKLRLQYPDREYVLEKNLNVDGDLEWQGISPEKFAVNLEKVEEIINVMTNLTADFIPEQSFENTGLEKNLLIVEANGPDTNNVIMIGDGDGSGLFYTKRGDSDNIYLILEDKKNVLDVKLEDLKN